jgi:hypothetical protein
MPYKKSSAQRGPAMPCRPRSAEPGHAEPRQAMPSPAGLAFTLPFLELAGLAVFARAPPLNCFLDRGWQLSSAYDWAKVV